MSTPSPDPQKGEINYQSSETSDRVLLTHIHTCTCTEKPLTEPSTNSRSGNLQQIVNNSHGSNHIHTVAHSHSPKITHSSKMKGGNCNCHKQEDCEDIAEFEQTDQVRKTDADDRIEVSPLPPALPPRPPPRPRYDGSLGSRYRPRISSHSGGGLRKYVICCCISGSVTILIGVLFLAVYFLLRSYTSTLVYFETVPTFVPATMLILTGICVMSLAKRKNRYSFLIKICGVSCLVCALTCVLVTITTTVIHMNRLQTLRECVYTQKTKTCTCYSVLLEAHAATDEGMRYVFDSTPDCEVIHGALYACLRAMFGLSVTGILICIFSCMLVYQLLSHEKKKMYWEQLELRCRSFYQQHSRPSSNHSSVRGPPVPPSTYCSCCDECRYPSIPAGPHVYPWDNHLNPDRFWTPGRVGNFYSPNPEDGTTNIPDDHTRVRPLSGWSWRRLPWSRSNVSQNNSRRDGPMTYQEGVSSADSQYGFSHRPGGDNNLQEQMTGSTGSYSILDNRPPIGGVYVWGPPPPYSNPNSPARRPMQSPSRYHHIHHHSHGHESHCQMNENSQLHRGSRRMRPHFNNKDNYENTTEPEIHRVNDNNESTDTSSCIDRISHTLPVRKMKKRTEMASVKSNVQPTTRTNVQTVFNQNNQEETKENEHGYQESNMSESKPNENPNCRFLPRLQGVENAAFQKQENSPRKPEPSESEVYFADVSSCCNISVRNDGQDSSLYDEAMEAQKPRLISLQKTDPKDVNTNQLLQTFQENISSSTVTEDEDYLAHRMGNRQMSVRSRMPFPLPDTNDMEFNADSCLQLLPKDISQNSLCSSVQTPLTETTDDTISPDECCSYFQEKSCEQTPKHRGFPEHYLAPDAQYEIIPEQENYHHQNTSNLTNTISGLSYDQNYYNQNKMNFSYNSGNKNVPPKTLNLNQQSRRNLGSNISALIQNLGGNTGGLLYGEATTEDETTQGQGCHSDGTMDSGWQSGSDKADNRKKEDEDVH
ncbi:uncharacterized protein LOC130894209 isoform X1 [Diorhabda carinulata]|uniref:uncharacterized protein LOC130894209 isoform X1 n=1 Tax=Diorhabda carinulata TaxID=1163345 RepID=UPI0025A2CF75|nr:uncharacterized protein LOC130894209 isoform X1 [Diorhabda carinulata]XP_057656835.1 uncharacterized protein LOC130894209 isoform X1 [Diorhabda carinulata]